MGAEVIVMSNSTEAPSEPRLTLVLEDPDASVRLRGALAAGMRPAAEQVDVLVRRCAVEPEFSVRDMLTWALTRHDPQAVVDRLLIELHSPEPQARSQALHTLSKIGDRRAWPAITTALLEDADDDVARTAWRTAVVLVPEASAPGLADRLVTQLGRGDRDTQLSLSRAIVALGEVGTAALRRASTHPDDAVRAHADVTERLARDPELAVDAAVASAIRARTLRGAPLVDDHN
jgi:HEAT repeat protein